MTGYFKYIFNDDEWNIYVVDDDDTSIAEEGAGAQTDFYKKEIYFRKDEIGLDTVLHELWHVYFGYLYLEHIGEISVTQLEEITAALFADRGSKIIKRGEDILKKLIEMRDTPDEIESN
jgi:hypothetical protein